MTSRDSRGISYTAAFFILIAFAIACLSVANNVNAMVWKAMTGKSYDEFLTGLTNPAYARAYQVTHCLNAVIGFMVPTLIVAFFGRSTCIALNWNNNSGIGQTTFAGVRDCGSRHLCRRRFERF